jgi:hypothetical protein
MSPYPPSLHDSYGAARGLTKDEIKLVEESAPR